MQFGVLGTVFVNATTQEYHPWENPLLIQGVEGWNPWSPYRNPMNPDNFAKPEVAALIARVVNGQIVPDPMAAAFRIVGNVPMLAIQMNDRTVNAGAICALLGNDTNKASVRAKSVAICELLGIFPPDETLADKIWDALYPGV